MNYIPIFAAIVGGIIALTGAYLQFLLQRSNQRGKDKWERLRQAYGLILSNFQHMAQVYRVVGEGLQGLSAVDTTVLKDLRFGVNDHFALLTLESQTAEHARIMEKISAIKSGFDATPIESGSNTTAFFYQTNRLIEEVRVAMSAYLQKLDR